MNGWPAGTPIPNTEFEIYNARTGNLVDTIKTDRNGVASSRPLPLGRYKIVESKAADFYGLDQTPIEVEIEYAGQIVKAAMTNKSLYTNVSIKKTGYVEVMPSQQIRYDFSGIGNNSTTSLTSFYWRDTLPTQAVRLDKIVTGTYNVPGNYKVVYKTNLNPNYRTICKNISWTCTGRWCRQIRFGRSSPTFRRRLWRPSGNGRLGRSSPPSACGKTEKAGAWRPSTQRIFWIRPDSCASIFWRKQAGLMTLPEKSTADTIFL